MKKRVYDDDDGRTIADMDIEGMPYNSGLRGMIRNAGRKNSPDPLSGKDNIFVENARRSQYMPAPETDRQTERMIIRHAILAALTVALIFGGCAALFILFCNYIWFA